MERCNACEGLTRIGCDHIRELACLGLARMAQLPFTPEAEAISLKMVDDAVVGLEGIGCQLPAETIGRQIIEQSAGK